MNLIDFPNEKQNERKSKISNDCIALNRYARKKSNYNLNDSNSVNRLNVNYTLLSHALRCFQ